MKIIRFKTDTNKGQMVEVDRWEALRIIESLAHQLRESSPNTGRQEYWADIVDADLGDQGQEYFSIAVVEKK